MREPCTLLLEDGFEFPGRGFGHPVNTDSFRDTANPTGVGEVLFNTAMSGYHEMLTDPSYTGQIVVMTYPHVGNYGCDPAWGESGEHERAQVRAVKPAGYVVRELYDGPIPEGRISLDEFLRSSGVPGVTGVDTRRLTLHIRNAGSQNGAIVPHEGSRTLPAEIRTHILPVVQGFPPMIGRDLISLVGAEDAVVVNGDGSPSVVLLDCGLKANILRELVKRGCRVTVVPSDSSADRITESGADLLFISNGPGDPAVLDAQVEMVRSLVGKMPVVGICLGHQLIARAIGASTFKMAFGHHGVNHPVREEGTGRVFVTSQNHGFAVDEETVPEGCEIWFRNANDKTVEGLRDRSRGIASAQFHPESCPGPDDSLWIFDEFLRYAE
jgi:carbamoyl-phosphate synthase small subunit